MSQTDVRPVSPQSTVDKSSQPDPNGSEVRPDPPKRSSEKGSSDKIRIYDLAREMGQDNRDLLEACDRLGIPYKSHSSTISSKQAEQIRSDLGQRTPSPSRPKASRPQASKGSQPKPAARQDKQILTVRPPTNERRLQPRPPQAKDPAKDPQDQDATVDSKAALVGPPQRPQEIQRPSRPEKPDVTASQPEPSLNLETQTPEAKAASLTASSSPPQTLTKPKPDDLKAPPARPVKPSRDLETPESTPQPNEGEVRPSSPNQENVSDRDKSDQDTKGKDSKNESSKAAEVATPPQIDRRPTPPEVKVPEAKAKVLDPPRRPKTRSDKSQDPPKAKETPKPKESKAAPPTPKPETPRPKVFAPRPKSDTATPTKRSASADQSTEPPKPRPQLVGAPVRPGSAKPKPALTEKPQRQDEEAEGFVSATEDEPLNKPSRPQKPKPELVGPPIRHPAKPDRSRDDAAPSRVGLRSTKRKTSEEEEDELAALKPAATKTQTKRKRNRRRTEGEGDGGEVDVVASVSAAKQAEVSALKPLPRPSAKPTSASPAPRPAPAARTKSSQPKPKSTPAATTATAEEALEKILILEGTLTVQELATSLRVSETEIIKSLFMKGMMVNINQVLDQPTIETIATEFDFTVEHRESESQAKKTEMLDLDDIEHLVLRPPVVTIMGHVDHGKTTLLDAIRDTKVVEGEAGGITQRIGAYHVDVELEGEPKRVVFLDTPGHEAFTAMRARGTKVTDIAVLVVAADDGVQPQTLEAISHAKAAEVPIVVAVNKVDKPDSQPDRIKQQLSEQGLVPEEWGGDIPMVDVSALTRYNLDALLEMLLLVAEVGELQANPDRPAKGTVVEANLDKSRGPVATLLVQNGTLRIGDALVAGSVFGRVKAMIDDRGNRLEEAGPSSAVQLLGMSDVPSAGDVFLVYPNEREARRVADRVAEDLREKRLQQALSRRVSLGSISAKAQEGELKELNLIIKTDVQGSAEAILASLEQLSHEEVQIRVLLSSPGEITETDVDLAAASEAIIIGFSTTTAPGVRQLADRYGVDIREYDIIYNLLEEITDAMEGLLDPEQVEEPLGQAEVRMVIPIGKGAIAGSYIQSGKVVRNSMLRVRRKQTIVYEGRLDSLKRFKEDVREVASGFECGIGVDKFHDWQEGDVLEVYHYVLKRRTLASATASSRR